MRAFSDIGISLPCAVRMCVDARTHRVCRANGFRARVGQRLAALARDGERELVDTRLDARRERSENLDA